MDGDAEKQGWKDLCELDNKMPSVKAAWANRGWAEAAKQLRGLAHEANRLADLASPPTPPTP